MRTGWRGMGTNRMGGVRGITLGLMVLLTGCLSTRAVGQSATNAEQVAGAHPFDLTGTVDPNIPPPASIIGYEVGERAVRYDELIRYLKTLAAASPFVTMTSYGTTHEGRALYYLTITSEENQARLGDIKKANAQLSDPRQLETTRDALRIMQWLPGIAWMAYAIHGDELSSTDAAMQVAYQLAAGTDEATRALRDGLVVHIDPLMNPDGRERYLSQLQQLNGKVANFDYQAMQHMGLWSAGRGNHYLFDLNRDWLMQVHPETRGRAARILEWHPHLLVDSHEMGSLDTYLFDPPRAPFNVNLPEQNLVWRKRFSADQAKALDRHGWSYYTREWYEEWYPGYSNSWANLLGAVGILYEQARVNGGAIRQATGGLLTYREAVYHHVVSSFANLNTLLANRKELLRDRYEDRLWAVDPEQSGYETFLVRPSKDAVRLDRFADLLRRHGIEYVWARDPITAENAVDMFGTRRDRVAFPVGTLVVRTAQPHRRLLTALLQFDPHMSDAFLHEERKEIENGRGSRVYDVTGWNLGMAYALDAYWAERVGEVAAGSAGAHDGRYPEQRSGYGYVIDGASSNVPEAIARLLDKGCKVRVAKQPFRVAGVDFDAGALLLRNRENPDDVHTRARDALIGLGVDVYGADTALSEFGPDLGGQQFTLLTAPRVAIATQWPLSSTSFGAVWFSLDARIGLRCSPLNIQYLGRWDLRRYNVIVLPSTFSPGALGSMLNASVRKRLKRWVEAGGTLIAIGGSAAFLAGKDHPIGSVRLRRDVLDKLDEYDEALARERSAWDVVVDPEDVWGTKRGNESSGVGQDNCAETEESDERKPSGAGVADSGEGDRSEEHKDEEALVREDEWMRKFAPIGVIAASRVNREHWLAFGVPGNRVNPDLLPVLLSGRYVLESKPPVVTPVRLTGGDTIRLSGLMWPEARVREADAAYATVERIGNGQVILFAGDPVFRGYFEGTTRLLLNAILLGPGLGTNQPVPW